MKKECVQAVAIALGRPITQAEAASIESRVVSMMRQLAQQDRAAWTAKPRDVQFREAADAAAKDLIQEAAKKKQRVALTILAHDRIAAHLREQQARGISAIDSLSRMIAAHADTQGRTLSVESQADAIAADALRQIIGTLEVSHPKVFGLFENAEGSRALIKELFGEPSGVPEAKQGAKLFADMAETLRQRFNAAGGDVGKLDDWGAPHHHSQMRVAAKGRDAWVASILPRMNRAKYVNDDGSPMSDQQLVDFLGEAWTTIASGGANKIEPGQVRGSGMRANRGNASRQIHFKSADDYIAYQSEFGEHQLYDVLIKHIQGVAQDIALVETFSPNADHLFRFWRDKAVRDAKLADPTKIGAADRDAVRLDNLYNVVSGKTLPVASQWLARGFDAVRNWMVASKLGSAVISSISDEATLYLTSKVNHLPLADVFRNEIAALNPANATEKRLALRAGLSMRTFTNSMNRYGADALGASFSAKTANAVMRASGLNAITEARKRAFGVTMMSALGQVAKDAKSLADLDKHDHRILLSKGITERDFAVWKKATPEDWGDGNNTMLTPDAIYRVSDADILAIDPKANPRRVREQAATRLLGVVLEETSIAVIEPGARERALMYGGLQRGTRRGELTRSIFLFKSFPIAMFMRHFLRAWDQPTGTGKAVYLSALLAGTTVMGMLAQQITQLLQGKDPRNMNPADGGMRTWVQALVKGGGLGLYGDFLFSEATEHGQKLSATLLGPMVGLADEAFDLTQGNIVQAMQGKNTHLGAETVKFVKSNLPGQNLWYTRAVLDHMIFQQFQEYFSPGYLARMKSRAQREFGQRFWWEPGHMLPSRPPDLTAVEGQ